MSTLLYRIVLSLAVLPFFHVDTHAQFDLQDVKELARKMTNPPMQNVQEALDEIRCEFECIEDRERCVLWARLDDFDCMLNCWNTWGPEAQIAENGVYNSYWHEQCDSFCESSHHSDMERCWWEYDWCRGSC